MESVRRSATVGDLGLDEEQSLCGAAGPGACDGTRESAPAQERREPLESYRGYIGAAGADAEVERFADGVRVRGFDRHRGRDFEVESHQDGRELELRVGGRTQRMTIAEGGSATFDDGITTHVGDLRRWPVPMRRALAFARQVHRQALRKALDPAAAQRRREQVVVDGALARSRVLRAQTEPFEAAVGAVETASSRLEALIRDQGKAFVEHEAMYAYTHRNYARLRPRLVVARGAGHELSVGEKVPQIFKDRNRMRTRFRHAFEEVERAADRAVARLATPEFAALTRPQQLHFASRAMLHCQGMPKASRRLAAMVTDGRAGKGPFALLQSLEHDPGKLGHDIRKGLSLASKRAKVEKEWGGHALTSVAGKAIFVIRASSSALGLGNALASIIHTGGKAEDWLALGKYSTSLASMAAETLGKTTAKRLSSKISSVATGILAVAQIKVDESALYNLGRGITAAGAAFSAAGLPQVGSVLILMGELIAGLAAKPAEHPIEGLMRQYHLLAEGSR